MGLPSGWKCDLVFINKMKELITKYEGKELIRQVRDMCGVSEKEALNNISAAKELKSLETEINFQKLPNKAKILKPALLMEIAEEEFTDAISKFSSLYQWSHQQKGTRIMDLRSFIPHIA